MKQITHQATGMINDVVTIIRDPKNPLGKRFAADGAKSANVQVSQAFAEQRFVPTAKEMAAVIMEVSNDPNAALINASFRDIPMGETFVILSENQFGLQLGIKTREAMAGVHSIKIGGKTYKAVGRFKENVQPSSWQILDRDIDSHTPPQYANLSYASWFIEVEKLLPGLSTAARISTQSAMHSGYAVNRWLTFQQARSLGAHVRKGETGTEVVFFKMHEFGAGPTEAGSPDDRKVIPLLRSFTVFNADQIDDLPAALMPAPAVVHEWQACEAAEAILATSGANIRHGGSKAFYSPGEDRIQLPERSAFATAMDYSHVALHELTHWTGHPSRCNRVLSGRQHIEAYAMEELVAEMGSAFLTDHCGLPGQLQHAAYIETWLRALKSDKRLIFTAASQAQKASDFLIGQPVDAVAPAVAVPA